MLVTLALFLIGVSVLAFRRRRTYGTGVHVDEATVGWDEEFFHRHKAHGTEVRIDETTIGRDVGFFLIFFAIAAGAGAMVFQSTIPVSLDVLFMRWDLAPLDLWAVGLALISGGYFYAVLRHPVRLRAKYLLVCGVLYLIYLVVAVFAVV
jgi:hypothetical protein